MKKNKKEPKTILEKQFPIWLKTTLTYFIIFSILALCVIILIYRYVNKINDSQEFAYQSSTQPLAPKTLSASDEILLQNEIKSQNNRLAQVEANLNQWQSIPQLTHQLLAREILREVLRGHIPLKTFVLYLKKTPDPWTTPILNSLSTIPECKTYAQLQSSLVLSQEPLTRSQHVKKVLNSFVRIRKLDETGHYVTGHIDDINKALKEHNIAEALEAFDKLPPKEQTELASWRQEAQNRLTLETIKQKLLLDLAGSS